MTKLKEVIRERGLRQDWVADKIGVSSSHLSALVGGNIKGSRLLRRVVADFFDMPQDELFPASAKKK